MISLESHDHKWRSCDAKGVDFYSKDTPPGPFSLYGRHSALEEVVGGVPRVEDVGLVWEEVFKAGIAFCSRYGETARMR